MSFRKKGRNFRPKSGISFQNSSDSKTAIAETLMKEFGSSGGAIKAVMAYTGAGERTVKNWFAAKNSPNGENLIKLMRHSDEILEIILLLSGREDILATKTLADARKKLVEMLEIVDQLLPYD